MTSTTETTTPCAGEGVGYFNCDVPGGCDDCRHLAISIDDFEQFDAWADDLETMAAVLTEKAAMRRRTAAHLAHRAG